RTRKGCAERRSNGRPPAEAARAASPGSSCRIWPGAWAGGWTRKAIPGKARSGFPSGIAEERSNKNRPPVGGRGRRVGLEIRRPPVFLLVEAFSLQIGRRIDGRGILAHLEVQLRRVGRA